MKALTHLAPLCFLACFMTSCALTTYIPGVVNDPMIQEAPELQISGFAGFKHVELQTAFSPVNHFTVMANGFVGLLNGSAENESKFLEMGVGYYGKLKDDLLFSLHTGYGQAGVFSTKAHRSNQNAREVLSATYGRAFIQPSISSQLNKGTRVGFALRMSHVKYLKYDHADWVNYGNRDQLVVESYSDPGPFKVITPTMTMRTGWEHFKILFQLGFRIRTDTEVLPFFFTGIQLNLGKSYLKRESK